MRLIAASIAALALAIFGGAVVISQALDTSSGPSQAEVVQNACAELVSTEDEVAECVLNTLDPSP